MSRTYYWIYVPSIDESGKVRDILYRRSFETENDAYKRAAELFAGRQAEVFAFTTSNLVEANRALRAKLLERRSRTLEQIFNPIRHNTE